MDRLISEQAVIDAIATWVKSSEPYDRNGWLIPRYLYDRIKAIPTAEPQTGHWITTGDYYTGAYGDIDYVECSCCHEYSLEEGDYCPNCGCRMIES